MFSTNWQKSSYCGANVDCIEVRTADGLVELRESDTGHTVIRTTPTKFATFLQGIKAGELDHLTTPTA